MVETVYLLGAGFNYSVVHTHGVHRIRRPPLATNFFQVLFEDGRYEGLLEFIRNRIYVDILFDEIRRFWHLDLAALKREPFDIEECLTLFESQLLDEKEPESDRALTLQRARFALRSLLLMYLTDLLSDVNPTAQRFGLDVLRSKADVMTFNYDTMAEQAIASASGIGPKPMPDNWRRGGRLVNPLLDEDLDASHVTWRPHLAYSFKLDEVTLPVAGGSDYIEGDRYYSHPNNRLYQHSRVLKLHGSISWLQYTNIRFYEEPKREAPPGGIVSDHHPHYSWAMPPMKDSWVMEPVIIPPHLYKDFGEHPFPTVWSAALDTLKECKTLIVVGYSFPPSDFRTRRLFLEAFSSHELTRLVVVNPDPEVAKVVRRLSHYSGQPETYKDLRYFYGVPASWFDPPEVAEGT
jgi:hypothetical protein